jgi:hypothetical protein
MVSGGLVLVHQPYCKSRDTTRSGLPVRYRRIADVCLVRTRIVDAPTLAVHLTGC